MICDFLLLLLPALVDLRAKEGPTHCCAIATSYQLAICWVDRFRFIHLGIWEDQWLSSEAFPKTGLGLLSCLWALLIKDRCVVAHSIELSIVEAYTTRASPISS